MALVIENGSIVEGAESYVTVAEAKAYAANRGVYLDQEDDGAVEILARQATDYLESLRSAYVGSKIQASQPLQWPRKEAEIEGEAFPDDEIPKQLKSAQIQLMMDIYGGLDPLPSSDGRATLREKVDVLEVEYMNNGSTISVPHLPKVMALLEPLFGTGGMSIINIPLRHA